MNALLFPGQGSQIVGMGLEFYNNFDLVKKIFKQADERLNYKISKMILEGPEDELKLTENTQPAILTVSYSIFKVLKEEFLVLNEENYCISSLSRLDPNFDSINYWRGPMWANLTYMIINGLKKSNHSDLALPIQNNCMKNIESLGFYEYFDSIDHLGCGDNHFSWTASVYICLITNFQF